ncbi:MAG: hypothetical protein J3R72DRAFT_442805 [Linnemannia gamsii]|nr:MAG: hypothetical protein J3R72DRAFT_442805 [Linnemannia gamsii]
MNRGSCRHITLLIEANKGRRTREDTRLGEKRRRAHTINHPPRIPSSVEKNDYHPHLRRITIVSLFTLLSFSLLSSLSVFVPSSSSLSLYFSHPPLLHTDHKRTHTLTLNNNNNNRKQRKMLKKFGLQSYKDKDLDPPPRLFSSNHNDSSSSAPTSPLRVTSNNDNNNNQDKDKEKKKKKALRAAASFDSMDSLSHATRPHLPSTVYDPNPFPLDPTQPGGVSRFNAFTKHTRTETREVESIDIEIEETKGFVSGKSRHSVDQQDLHHVVRIERSKQEEEGSDDLEVEYELSRRNQNNKNAISKLGAGLKGAFMGKTGFGGKSQDNDKAVVKETTIKPEEQPEVDAVLQHHLQLQQQQQEVHLRQQEQHYQRQQRYTQEQDVSSRGHRGRPRERQRTRSGPIHHQGRSGQSGGGGRGSGIRAGRGGEDSSSPSYHKESRDPFTDRRPRVHSLSPPPAPGQEHRGSAAYWPDGREGSHPDDQEQTSPFLPQTSSHHHHGRQQHQQQYDRPRPLSQASDSDNGELSRHARDGRRHSRERNESDRTRRDAMGGAAGGQRRQSGLYQVTNAAPISRTSSDIGEEERLAAARDDQRSPQRSVPDRLSRAKEWVASHSKNNSIAAPAPVMDREAVLASLPGAFPSRPPHRRSMDSFDDYGVITPPRGSYFINAGRGGGGYDPRERIAMVDQMRMQELQRSGYRSSMADDDGHYWNRQLEGYEQRDRYRQSRVDYEYDGAQHSGPYYGYAPGGPDDPDPYDETESTLAPGSAIGGVSKGKAGAEKNTDAAKKIAPLQPTKGDEENQDLIVVRAPNKRRMILRLISLSSSLLVLVLLIAAAPVSHSSSPFTSAVGLAFHYVVAILSTLVSAAFLFNYFSRRLRRQEKMKRYLLFGLDIFMSILWLIDAFVCISKFPCAVGGQNGWCDMYNSSVFLGIVAFLSFLAAFIWDIWGSFDHSDSKLFGTGPLIKPAPAGWDRKALAKQGAGPGWGGAGGARQQGNMPPGAWPGQQGQQGQGQGGGPLKKPKNSKALW